MSAQGLSNCFFALASGALGELFRVRMFEGWGAKTILYYGIV